MQHLKHVHEVHRHAVLYFLYAPGILRNLYVIGATLRFHTSALGTQFCPSNEYQYFRLGVYGRLRVLHMWVFHESLAVVRFRDPYSIRYLLID